LEFFFDVYIMSLFNYYHFLSITTYVSLLQFHVACHVKNLTTGEISKNDVCRCGDKTVACDLGPVNVRDIQLTFCNKLTDQNLDELFILVIIWIALIMLITLHSLVPRYLLPFYASFNLCRSTIPVQDLWSAIQF